VTGGPKSSDERNLSRRPRNSARTKHFPTTQNRSTGCARTGGSTQPRVFEWSVRWTLVSSLARIVYCPSTALRLSQALARLIFEFPRNRRSYEEARQPDVRAGQPFAEGRGSRGAQDESADWRIWDRRDPGGHTGAFGDAGSKS